MIPMNSQKKAIAIFGGAFDPIHLGHISMIKNLDKI
jgi:cytidyltransferase-like protein